MAGRVEQGNEPQPNWWQIIRAYKTGVGLGIDRFPHRALDTTRFGYLGPLNRFLRKIGLTNEKFAPPLGVLAALESGYGSMTESWRILREWKIKSKPDSDYGKEADSDYQDSIRPRMLPTVLRAIRETILDKKLSLRTPRNFIAVLRGKTKEPFAQRLFNERRKAFVASEVFALLATGAVALLVNDYIQGISPVDVANVLKTVTTILGVLIGGISGGTGGVILGGEEDRITREAIARGAIGAVVGGISGGFIGSTLPPDQLLVDVREPLTILTRVAPFAIVNLASLLPFPITRPGREVPKEKIDEAMKRLKEGERRVKIPRQRRMIRFRDKVLEQIEELWPEIKYLIAPLVGVWGEREISEGESFTIEPRNPGLFCWITDELAHRLVETNFAPGNSLSEDLREEIENTQTLSDLLSLAAKTHLLRAGITLPYPSCIEEFFKTYGEERLDVVKALSSADPILAVNVALPALARIHFPLAAMSLKDYFNILKEYFDATTYGEAGRNSGNSGELLALQAIWLQKLAEKMKSDSYSGDPFQDDPFVIRDPAMEQTALEKSVAEVMRPGLPVEALEVLAMFSQEGLKIDDFGTGADKHSLAAIGKAVVNGEVSPLMIGGIVSAINFYIKAGELYKSIYPRQRNLFDTAIVNLTYLRDEFIRLIINDFFANYSQLISDTDYPEAKRINLAIQLMLRECPKETVINLIFHLKNLYPGSGKEAEKQEKSRAIALFLSRIYHWVSELKPENDEILTYLRESLAFFRKPLIDMLKDLIKNDTDTSIGSVSERNRFVDEVYRIKLNHLLSTLFDIVFNIGTPEEIITMLGQLRTRIDSYLRSVENLTYPLIWSNPPPLRNFVNELIETFNKILTQGPAIIEERGRAGEFDQKIATGIIDLIHKAENERQTLLKTLDEGDQTKTESLAHGFYMQQPGGQ